MEPETAAEPIGPNGAGDGEGDEELAKAQKPPADAARALVQRLVEAGEWPRPELLEQILATGEAATAPLLEIIEAEPNAWPEEVVINAIGLLSMLRPAAALPALVANARQSSREASGPAGRGACVLRSEGL